MSSHPIKLGKVTVIDGETGEVISEKRNAMTLLPCGPNVCQECAVDHPHNAPHDQQSMYYQMKFHATHGRYPTWTDAMVHCDDETKAIAKEALLGVLRKHGMEIPADLMESPKKGR